jgi:hypothetical protein
MTQSFTQKNIWPQTSVSSETQAQTGHSYLRLCEAQYCQMRVQRCILPPPAHKVSTLLGEVVN